MVILAHSGVPPDAWLNCPWGRFSVPGPDKA
jgi:hypothetical protein